MTSRMSPTSGLVADVAIVDALLDVGPRGCCPSLPGEKSWRLAGALALERGADQGSVATRRRQWRQDIGVLLFVDWKIV